MYVILNLLHQKSNLSFVVISFDTSFMVILPSKAISTSKGLGTRDAIAGRGGCNFVKAFRLIPLILLLLPPHPHNFHKVMIYVMIGFQNFSLIYHISHINPKNASACGMGFVFFRFEVIFNHQKNKHGFLPKTQLRRFHP